MSKITFACFLKVLNEISLLINDPNANLDVQIVRSHVSKLYCGLEEDLKLLNATLESLMKKNKILTESIDALLKHRIDKLSIAVQNQHLNMLYDLSELQNNVSKSKIENQKLQHLCYNYEVAERKIKSEITVIQSQAPMLKSKINDELILMKKVEDDILLAIQERSRAESNLEYQKEKFKNLLKLLKCEEIEIEKDYKETEQKLQAAKKIYEDTVSLAFNLKSATEKAIRDKEETEKNEENLKATLEMIRLEQTDAQNELEHVKKISYEHQNELDKKVAELRKSLKILNTKLNGKIDQEASKAKIKLSIQEGDTLNAANKVKALEAELEMKLQTIENMQQETNDIRVKINRLEIRKRQATELLDGIQGEYKTTAKEHGIVTVEYEAVRKKAQNDEQKVRAVLEQIQGKVEEEIALRETILTQIRMTIADLEQAKAEALNRRQQLEEFVKLAENAALDAKNIFERVFDSYQIVNEKLENKRLSYKKLMIEWEEESSFKQKKIDEMNTELLKKINESQEMKVRLKNLKNDIKSMRNKKSELVKDIDTVVKKKINTEKDVLELERKVFNLNLEVNDLQILFDSVKKSIEDTWKRKHETSELNQGILKKRWSVKQTALEELTVTIENNKNLSLNYRLIQETKFKLNSNYLEYKDFYNFTKLLLSDVKELVKFSEIYSFNQNFCDEIQDNLIEDDFLRIKNSFLKGDLRTYAICKQFESK